MAAAPAPPPRRALPGDLPLLAHALAQPPPPDGGDRVQQLWREWRHRPSARARLGQALLLAARERYGERQEP